MAVGLLLITAASAANVHVAGCSSSRVFLLEEQQAGAPSRSGEKTEELARLSGDGQVAPLPCRSGPLPPSESESGSSCRGP